VVTNTHESTGLIEIDPRQLREMLDRDEAHLIDVREADEHARDRIEGSTLLAASSLGASALPEDGERIVVLHCRSGQRSADVGARALAAGRPSIHHLAGGLLAWRDAGLPVIENRRVPISIMRQVQISAGSLVAIGTGLGAFVHPGWLVLSGFVGLGLVFAGATGTCGMASVLALMPWNRRA
jgi:rhodanese-related sulfurtransferase